MSNILQNLKVAEFIVLESDKETLSSIVEKYNKLMETNKSDSDLSIVHNNNDCYHILLNKAVTLSVISSYGLDNIHSAKVVKAHLNNKGIYEKGKIIDEYYKRLCGSFTKHGYSIADIINTSDITSSLMTFGINTVDEITEVEPVENEDDVDSPEVEWDDIDMSEFNQDADEIDALIEEAALNDEDDDDEDEEEQHKQELDRSDVSGKADDLTDSDAEFNEEVAAYVENIIDNILSVYSAIYSPLFLNPPKGVMYKDEEKNQYAIMSVGKDGENTGVKVHNIPSLRMFISKIYGNILNNYPVIKEAPKVGDAGMHITTTWMNPDGTMRYNYAPHIQVRNCMGVYRDPKTGLLKRAKTWSEFKSKLSKELKPTITALLKRVDLNNEDIVTRAVSSIQEFYTTIFLVNEFDKEKVMRFTVYSQSIAFSANSNDMAQYIVNSNPLIKPSLNAYKIMSDTENNGIKQILIVTDVDKYRGEINFAYKTIGKIVQSGGTIDISHAIVGTDLEGNPVEVNLNNNAYTSIGIVAGSRSGKGVLTLSLLASMLAANCPVVYLDYKPDMAGAFWKLERQVPGSKILAIDGQTNKLDGMGPVRNYTAGKGCPPKVYNEISTVFNVIPYVKGVQIMNLIGKARVMGIASSKKKMFFILDEAQKCGGSIADATKTIESDIINNKEWKPKPKEAPSEEYKYAKKLLNMYKSTETAATEFLNTNAGSGNMSALVLGQQPDAGEWRGPFSTLIKKCPIKFLGNGTKGGSKYGLSEKTKGVDMLGTGYFGLSTSNISSPDTTTMIKTTLVLNDADYTPQNKGGKYTGALLNNITNEDIKKDVIDNDMMVSAKNEIALAAGIPEGSPNPLVGFPGLINYIGSMSGDGFDLATALSAGYMEVYNILAKLGIVGDNAPYPNVEAYMYSGKEDSLFTSNQLSNALNAGVTIYEYLENGAVLEDPSEEDGIQEDGEIIAMGAYGESDDEGNSQADDNQTPDLLLNNEDSSDTTENIRIVSTLLPTNKLINALPNTASLVEYYKTVIDDKVYKNKFVYGDRSNSPNGLAVAVRYLSNFHYLSAIRRIPYEAADFDRLHDYYISNTADIPNEFHFGACILRALDSGQLQYDTMPSEDMMRQFYMEAAPHNNAFNAFNQQTTGHGGYGVNPNDTFGQLIMEDEQSNKSGDQYIDDYSNSYMSATPVQPSIMDTPPIILAGSADSPVSLDLGNMSSPISTGVPIQPDELRNLVPLSTEALMKKNYSIEILLGYYRKFWLSRVRANVFNYSDRDHPGEGLKGACLCWGNLTFLKHVLGNQIDDYVTILSDRIRAGQDTNNNSKYALGIIQDYRTGGLKIDNMPSEQRLNEYVAMFRGLEPQPQQQQTYQQQQQQYQQQYNPYSGMNTPDNRYTQTYNSMSDQDRYNAASPDMYEGVYQSSFGYDQYGNTTFNQTRDSQNMSRLDPSAFMIVADCSSKLWKKFEKKLFESKNGTSFELNQRWINILQTMESSIGKSNIYHVQIINNSMLANGKIIRYDNIVQTQGFNDGLSLYDILSFKTMFKRLPMIQTLTIDEELLAKLAGEYGTDLSTLYDVFRNNPRLKKIDILRYDGQIVHLDRANLNASKNQLQQTMDETVAREQLEHLFARKNPNLYDKGPGYFKRVTRGIGAEARHGVVFVNDLGKNATKNNFSKAKELNSKAFKAMFDDKDPRLGKALKNSIGATFFGTLGLFSGIGYFATSLLRGGRK